MSNGRSASQQILLILAQMMRDGHLTYQQFEEQQRLLLSNQFQVNLDNREIGQDRPN